jgi:hypothetical protein
MACRSLHFAFHTGRRQASELVEMSLVPRLFISAGLDQLLAAFRWFGCELKGMKSWSSHNRNRTAVFDNSTARKSQNPAERLECRRPVRDDNQCPRTDFPKPPKDPNFGESIKARGRFIQNQNAWLLQKGSRESKTLALATRELAAIRSNSLPKPARQ